MGSFWKNVPSDCEQAVKELKKLRVFDLLDFDCEISYDDVWWMVLHEVDLYVEGECCYEADRNYMGESDPYAMRLSEAKKAERWLLKWLWLYNKYSGENFDYEGRLVDDEPVYEEPVNEEPVHEVKDNGYIKFVYNDGGRSKYFTAKNVGDCVTRAIANATGTDYKVVYDGLKELAKKERITKRHKKQSSVRDGVSKKTIKKYMDMIGWTWVPCMEIGSGCKVHVRADELPKGNLVLNLSGHLSCVKDGVLYDTYDCSREGTRCVYGYWIKEAV